jgi:hypothetical protein
LIRGPQFIPPAYINRAYPLLKGEAKKKSVEAKKKLSIRH